MSVRQKSIARSVFVSKTMLLQGLKAGELLDVGLTLPQAVGARQRYFYVFKRFLPRKIY